MLQVCSQGGDFKDDGHFGEGHALPMAAARASLDTGLERKFAGR
jgi:hypothetical protein